MATSNLTCRVFCGIVLVCPALLGCNDSPDHAEAILHVKRDEAGGNAVDFKVYKDMQGALLKSQFVLSRALASKDIPQGVTVKELERDLHVNSTNDTELIVLRLPIGERDPNEAETILNEIVQAYEKEVVNRERLQAVEMLMQKRKRYQHIYDEIVKNTEAVKVLGERLGTVDIDVFRARERVEDEVAKNHLLFLKQRLVELQLEKLEVDASMAEENQTNASKLVEQKIEFLSELIASQQDEIRSSSGMSGELQARLQVLDGLRDELKKVQADKTELEIEIDGRPRVSVIQPAIAK